MPHAVAICKCGSWRRTRVPSRQLPPYTHSLSASQVPCIGRVTQTNLAAVCIASALVIVWFVFRRSPWAFVMQDVFGISVCCVFLLQVRLSNIRVSCAPAPAPARPCNHGFCWRCFPAPLTLVSALP